MLGRELVSFRSESESYFNGVQRLHLLAWKRIKRPKERQQKSGTITGLLITETGTVSMHIPTVVTFGLNRRIAPYIRQMTTSKTHLSPPGNRFQSVPVEWLIEIRNPIVSSYLSICLSLIFSCDKDVYKINLMWNLPCRPLLLDNHIDGNSWKANLRVRYGDISLAISLLSDSSLSGNGEFFVPRPIHPLLLVPPSSSFSHRLLLIFFCFVIRQLGVESCGTQPKPKADLSLTIPPMARSFRTVGYLWLFGLYRIDAISVFVFICLKKKKKRK